MENGGLLTMFNVFSEPPLHLSSGSSAGFPHGQDKKLGETGIAPFAHDRHGRPRARAHNSGRRQTAVAGDAVDQSDGRADHNHGQGPDSGSNISIRRDRGRRAETRHGHVDDNHRRRHRRRHCNRHRRRNQCIRVGYDTDDNKHYAPFSSTFP